MSNTKFWNVKTEGETSRIDLFGYVGGSKAWEAGFNEEDFLKEIRAIPADNELLISINSTGGSVFTALSIYALLKAHKGKVSIRVDGVAMSAATIITSAPNAKVVMPKGSMMMIHKVSTIVAGDSEDLRKTAEDMEKLEQNILAIYAEKTGKDVKDIQPLVEAETYFTAEEAVEFGLADELDETSVVKNICNAGAVYINGLEVKNEFINKAPKGFFKADTQTQSAVLNPKNKEVKPMDIETLKAEHPELVEAIRNEAMSEGIAQERARIQAIEDIAVAGHEDMVQSAKFDNAITAEQLAVAILKADKARDNKALSARINDAAELAGIPPSSNEGLIPNAEARANEDAELKAVIEAGAKAFSK